jgi:hypothetical protein
MAAVYLGPAWYAIDQQNSLGLFKLLKRKNSW